jgi:hypothetical protein
MPTSIGNDPDFSATFNPNIQYTRDETIDISLTLNALDRKVAKTVSTVPDSLGDKLFRISMKLAYCFSYESKEKTMTTLKDAKELLQS